MEDWKSLATGIFVVALVATFSGGDIVMAVDEDGSLIMGII